VQGSPRLYLSIRPLAQEDAILCEKILRSLPDWFGIESSIVEYRRALDALEPYVAEVNAELVGFLTLNRHNEHTSEIHVMAVLERFHGRGIGSAFLEHAERHLRAHSVEYLEVKTLGPSKRDPHYERTRHFYSARGFRAIEETNLWGKQNSCLILVKHLGHPNGVG
jgi:GNAT superfamily N-acetyltransferase